MDNRSVKGLVDMRQGKLPNREGVSTERCGRDVAGLIRHSWRHKWSAVARSNKFYTCAFMTNEGLEEDGSGTSITREHLIHLIRNKKSQGKTASAVHC